MVIILGAALKGGKVTVMPFHTQYNEPVRELERADPPRPLKMSKKLSSKFFAYSFV